MKTIKKEKLNAQDYFDAWLYTTPPYIHWTLHHLLQEAFQEGIQFQKGIRKEFKCKCGKKGKFIADGICRCGIYCPQCSLKAIDKG